MLLLGGIKMYTLQIKTIEFCLETTVRKIYGILHLRFNFVGICVYIRVVGSYHLTSRLLVSGHLEFGVQ